MEIKNTPSPGMVPPVPNATRKKEISTTTLENEIQNQLGIAFVPSIQIKKLNSNESNQMETTAQQQQQF